MPLQNERNSDASIEIFSPIKVTVTRRFVVLVFLFFVREEFAFQANYDVWIRRFWSFFFCRSSGGRSKVHKTKLMILLLNFHEILQCARNGWCAKIVRWPNACNRKRVS